MSEDPKKVYLVDFLCAELAPDLLRALGLRRQRRKASKEEAAHKRVARLEAEIAHLEAVKARQEEERKALVVRARDFLRVTASELIAVQTHSALRAAAGRPALDHLEVKLVHLRAEFASIEQTLWTIDPEADAFLAQLHRVIAEASPTVIQGGRGGDTPPAEGPQLTRGDLRVVHKQEG